MSNFNKNKILNIIIHTAVWGDEQYINIFLNINLKSILNNKNIQSSKKRIEFIIDTEQKYAEKITQAFKNYKLGKSFNVKLNIFEINFDEETNLNNKYTTLSTFQNRVIINANIDDYIIFNYADFIWGDQSFNTIYKIIENKKIESITFFALPVDQKKILEKFSKLNAEQVNKYFLNNELILLSLENLHNEVKYRVWENNEFFSVTPTYLIWKINSDIRCGLIIRAFHQTIVCLKKTKENKNFIERPFHSLDSGLSELLFSSKKPYVIRNSKNFFVCSLHFCKSDSRISNIIRHQNLKYISIYNGDNYFKWKSYTREDILDYLIINNQITKNQQFLALSEIYIYNKKVSNSDLTSVIKKSKKIIIQSDERTKYKIKKISLLQKKEATILLNNNLTNLQVKSTLLIPKIYLKTKIFNYIKNFIYTHLNSGSYIFLRKIYQLFKR